MRRKPAYLLLIAMISVIPLSGASQTRKVIFDTDFVFPPQDDAMALIFALNCPELEILGITTVAGNKNVERATVDALKVLEIAGRDDIPVFRGANRPLVHVDINHDLNYGVSVGGKQSWPGAEGSQKIVVQYDLDWDRFINLFVERVTRQGISQAIR